MLNKSKILITLGLVVLFITCMSLINKPEIKTPPSSSGQLIGSGPGYKLYRHNSGPDRIYVAITNTYGGISVTTP